MRRCLPLLLAGLLSACTTENTVREIPIDAIAVVAGDYDSVEDALLRQLVSYQLYEGYIVAATYDQEVDPDDIILKVEGLLGVEDELDAFGAVFVNSGTRGLGQFVYNGVEPDDDLVSDAQVVQSIVDFVNGGGVLVVSDWAYDLVEAGWPDMIEFAGDQAVLDDAQRGSRGSVQAMVHDEALVNDLGEDLLSVSYDFSHWAVILDVADDVDVFMSGDVSYRASETEGEVDAGDLPLLVGFASGSGHVYFSTFHWRAQVPAVADAVLFSIVAGLNPGGGEEEDDSPADTGS